MATVSIKEIDVHHVALAMIAQYQNRAFLVEMRNIAQHVKKKDEKSLNTWLRIADKIE